MLFYFNANLEPTEEHYVGEHLRTQLEDDYGEEYVHCINGVFVCREDERDEKAIALIVVKDADTFDEAKAWAADTIDFVNRWGTESDEDEDDEIES
jgi:hypothetical protein